MSGRGTSQTPRSTDWEAKLGPSIDGRLQKGKSAGRLVQLLLGGVCLLSGAACLLLGIVDGFDRYYRNGPAAVLRSVVFPVFLGVVLVVIGLAFFQAASKSASKILTLYTQGLVLAEGKTEQAWHWDDLASIRTSLTRRHFLGVPGRVQHTYTLAQRSGERMVLDDRVRDVETLAEKIRERAIPLIYARYAPTFDQGTALAFGPVTIEIGSGLTYKKRIYVWQSILRTDVQAGKLVVVVQEPNGRRRTLKIDVQELPNLDVLLVFLCRMAETTVTPDSRSGVVD